MMKTAFTTLLTLSGFAYANTGPFHKGINVRLQQSGSTGFKTRDQWFESFRRISALPGNFTAVRLYATQEAGGYRPLQWIIDASREYGLDLLLGVYLDNGTDKSSAEVQRGRFATEFDELKQGLVYAATKGALNSIIGVSVGNEDFHDKKQRPGDVVNMILKVQDWIHWRFNGTCIPVGHTDTYYEIMNPNNSEVGHWTSQLDSSINNTSGCTSRRFPGRELVPLLGECTGRTSGPTVQLVNVEDGRGFGQVPHSHSHWKDRLANCEFPEPSELACLPEALILQQDGQHESVQGSAAGLKTYWDEVICSQMFLTRDAFFYIDDDTGTTPNGGPHWGILDEQGNAKIDLNCPKTGPVI